MSIGGDQIVASQGDVSEAVGAPGINDPLQSSLAGEFDGLVELRLGPVNFAQVVGDHPVHGQRSGELWVVTDVAPHLVAARK